VIDIWVGGLGFVAVLVICGWLCWRATRHARPRQFRFVPVEKLGPNYAGGDNAWQGCLVTDSVITAEEGEILRAAVERYRVKNDPPSEGDRFEIWQGELVRV
jgi:hypothetical protein